MSSARLALGDADEASVLFAFRHWRDESGAVLREAHAGVALSRPSCPTLLIASREDADVPPALSRSLAGAWEMDLLQTLSGSHVGPLLGREAADIAVQAVEWLNRPVPDG